MEDTATVEICRAQIWQWIRHRPPSWWMGGPLHLNFPGISWERKRPESSWRWADSPSCLAGLPSRQTCVDNLVTSSDFPEFMTLQRTTDFARK